MEGINFIGAVGLGAIIVKLIDTYILHKKTQESEYIRWMRDNKLVAYSSLAEDLLSLGLNNKAWQPFEAHANTAKAILLLDDQDLVDRINQAIINIDRLHYLSTNKNPENELESEALYTQLNADVRILVKDLHQDLINTK